MKTTAYRSLYNDRTTILSSQDEYVAKRKEEVSIFRLEAGKNFIVSFR
jgi:hypothetical protein